MVTIIIKHERKPEAITSDQDPSPANIIVLCGWRPVWSLNAATWQPQRPPVGWPICHKSTDPQYTQEEEEGKKDHQHGPYASGLCFAAIQNTMFLLRFKMSRSLLVFSIAYFKNVQIQSTYIWGSLSTLTLLILTLSKVSFSDILRNNYLDHFDTFGENYDFDTFENDTFESANRN